MQPKQHRLTTVEFITELFCRVDDGMKRVSKHPQASLWPSEVVTLELFFALKGIGNCAFYRWLTPRLWKQRFAVNPLRSDLDRRHSR